MSVWSTSTGGLLGRLGDIFSSAWAPDSRNIAISTVGSQMSLIDTLTQDGTTIYRGSESPIALAFQPDGAAAAFSGFSDTSIRTTSVNRAGKSEDLTRQLAAPQRQRHASSR